MSEAPRDNMICVGALAGAHGVRGDVRLKSFCADPRAIETYQPLFDETGRSWRFTLKGPVKGGFIARLEGVGSREEAEALKGTRLYAPREALPPLEEDEFYHADLIGLEVVDTGGDRIGRVKALFDHGAGDILEIQLTGSPKTALLPFTRAFVPTVDLEAGRIVIDPPEDWP